VAASPSTEHPGALRSLLRLGGFERLAALGAIACLASLPLPWYELRFAAGLGKSGLGSFGFAEAALIITLLAALTLLVRVGGGRRPPLPLHEGTLLAAAGIWSAAIVGYLMLDRPTAVFADFPTDYRLGYGIFVALGGAVVLALAGLRIRRDELARQAATPTWAKVNREDRSPNAPSPPRSARSRS
jgi:hypothetical protein